MSYPQRCHASTTTTILYKKIKEQPKAKSRGKRRPNGFSKKQTCQVVWSLGMSRRGTAPAKLARLCSKKFRIGSRAMAVCTRRTKTRLPRGLAGTLWNGRFSTTGCALDVEDFRKTRFARRTQADAPEAVVRPFKKIQPLVAGLQEDCASRSGAADPVQARAITKNDGCWRTRARGRESARALQRPAEDRGGLAAVRPWVARASASWAFHRPVGGYGRAGEQARSARSSGIQRDPGPCCRGHVGRCGSREIRLPTGCVQVACGQSASSLIEKISRDQ